MEQENLILDKLTEIANKLSEQNLLQKTVLNFNEACIYLDVSPSHLYKLTSTKHIPHFCPQGKKLYFRREELDTYERYVDAVRDYWVQRARLASSVGGKLPGDEAPGEPLALPELPPGPAAEAGSQGIRGGAQ